MNTITINGVAFTERQIRSKARAIVRRMYGPAYKVGQAVVVVPGAFYGPRPDAALVTVRQSDGRLSAPLQFRPE